MNLEKLIKTSSSASASVSSYKFSSQSETWEDAGKVKAKLSVACSYYIDFKYIANREGTDLVKCNHCDIDGKIKYSKKSKPLKSDSDSKEKPIMMNCGVCGGSKHYHRDPVLAAQLNGKRLLLLGSIVPLVRNKISKISKGINLDGKTWSHALLHRCSITALDEACRTGVCNSCRGAVRTKKSGREGICPSCKGVGRQEAMTNTEIARGLRVYKQNYKRDYEKQYNLFRNIFIDLEREARVETFCE